MAWTRAVEILPHLTSEVSLDQGQLPMPNWTEGAQRSWVKWSRPTESAAKCRSPDLELWPPKIWMTRWTWDVLWVQGGWKRWQHLILTTHLRDRNSITVWAVWVHISIPTLTTLIITKTYPAYTILIRPTNLINLKHKLIIWRKLSTISRPNSTVWKKMKRIMIDWS